MVPPLIIHIALKCSFIDDDDDDDKSTSSAR